MTGTCCEHSYVFLIGCGAMACIECSAHTSVEDYAVERDHPGKRRYRSTDCKCGWADEVKNKGGRP